MRVQGVNHLLAHDPWAQYRLDIARQQGRPDAELESLRYMDDFHETVGALHQEVGTFVF